MIFPGRVCFYPNKIINPLDSGSQTCIPHVLLEELHIPFVPPRHLFIFSCKRESLIEERKQKSYIFEKIHDFYFAFAGDKLFNVEIALFLICIDVEYLVLVC